MVSLMDRRISPVCIILRNWFSVVAWWNKAIFSLTKKVSGTQICLMYSAPTTSFSRSTCLSKASLKTEIFSTLYFSLASYLGSVQNCRKYMSKVKSINFSDRSSIERMNSVTPKHFIFLNSKDFL